MATDTSAGFSAGFSAEADHDRWQRMWSHREQLLKVARRRSMTLEDAEDAVHEAMLRAAERPDLDDERLGAWLTTVTMRLCVDRYRQVNREAEVHTSPTLVAPGPVPVEEAVCDRAEAKWLAVRSGELPARQAEALRLKSQDLDVGQVAVRMGLSYRTVESLLARARRTLRQSLAATLGFALFLIGWGRPRGAGRTQAVAVASATATLAVAGFVLPHALDAGGGGGAGTGVGGTASQPTAGSPSTEAPRPEPEPKNSPAPAPTASVGSVASPPTSTLLPLSVPELPDVPEVLVSPLPLPATPEVPELSGVPDVPELPVEATAPPVTPVASVAPSVPTPTSLP